MNKILMPLLISFILFISYTPAQSGPKQGSITGGVIQTTDFFPKISGLVQPKEFHIGNEETEFHQDAIYYNFSKPTPKEGSNYYTDKNTLRKKTVVQMRHNF